MMATIDVFYNMSVFNHPNEMTLKDLSISGGMFRSMCFLAASPFFFFFLMWANFCMLTVGMHLVLGNAFSGADLMTRR